MTTTTIDRRPTAEAQMLACAACLRRFAVGQRCPRRPQAAAADRQDTIDRLHITAGACPICPEDLAHTASIWGGHYTDCADHTCAADLCHWAH